MSEPAFERLDEIERRLAAPAGVAIVSDYDGTLTPIVSQPDLATLPDSTRVLLRELSLLTQRRVALVSGRSLPDLIALVGLDLIYAGNHGLEIEADGFRFQEPSAAARAGALRDVLSGLRTRLSGIEGVSIENKGLTASAHFRQAAPGAEDRIRQAVEEELQARLGQFVVRNGKKVVEIVPAVDWHKGAAARWILDRVAPGATAVCLGDDATDEDMFASLPGEVTIRVGPPTVTAARYHVANSEEAIRFLQFVRNSWRGAGPRPAMGGPGARPTNITVTACSVSGPDRMPR